MRQGYWVLDGHELRHTDDVHEWGRMFEDKEARRVAATTVGEADVSTVFLGIDHNWDDDGPPLLFETMIFGGQWSESQWRYPTWDEAQAGHDRIVRSLKEGNQP